MKRILVVDDEPLIRELTKDILQQKGFDVVSWGDPLSAIRMCESEKFDLIITDIKMPLMDGLDFVREVKTKKPDMPFIVITGHGDYDLILKALKLGAHDFVCKPFRAEVLVKSVMDTLYKIELLEEIKRLRMLSKLHIASNEIMLGFDPVVAAHFALHNGMKEINALSGVIYLYDEGRFMRLYSIPEDFEIDEESLHAGFRSDLPVMKERDMVVKISSLKRDIGVMCLRLPSTPVKKSDMEIIMILSKIFGITLDNIDLYNGLRDKIKEVENLLLNVIKALSNALDAKSSWTKGHSERVREYSLIIADGLGLGDDDKRMLEISAMLHDIGKIGIYDYILEKPEKLLPEEFSVVKMHPLRGSEILSPISHLKDVAMIIAHHHERYDGSGYPDGLKGEDIPLLSRILAVSDAFDAMTSERPYRQTPGHRWALDELKKCSGIQFDPQIVNILVNYFEKKR